MVAKCGEVRVWHWAHKGRSPLCDRWWENETEWHRAWKDQFPVDWQESVHPAEDGQRHIADVKTPDGWVIEFQHSHIAPEERRSRDVFYRKLVWVVDATRRKTDAAQFRKALEASAPVGGGPVRRVRPDRCRLLQEWADSPAPIFFDFGSGPTLWWLVAGRHDEPMYVAPWSRIEFIATLLGKGSEGARDFDEFARNVNEIVAPYNARPQSQSLQPSPIHANGLRPRSVRRRFRF